MYQELGLEQPLQLQRWYKKLCCFYKIYGKQALVYLTKLIPTGNEAYQTRNVSNESSLSFKHIFFKKHIFPISYHRMEQTRPLPSNSASYNVFKNSIIKIIGPFLTRFSNVITQNGSN